MNNKVLAQKVRYFKETEGGHEKMCKIMEELWDEAVKKTQAEVALNLLKEGVHIEIIAKSLKISVEEAKKLLDENLK